MKSLDFIIQEVTHHATEVDIHHLISCLDLTSLDDLDTNTVISTLCKEALAAQVAAVCVYPHFVPLVKTILQGSTIKVATVANFPKGDEPLSEVLDSIEHSLNDGADEIDVVIPYAAFVDNCDEARLRAFVSDCKKIVGNKILKTILESGAFLDHKILERASLMCLEAGSDFLKTSTGKINQGASLEAAAVMLNAIVLFGDSKRGFKASGGVRKYEQAKLYYLLAQRFLGESWPTPDTFRIGASSLLKDLQDRL